MSISKTQLDRLQNRCEVVNTGWGKTGQRLSEDELYSILGDANVLLVGYEKVTARVIEKAKKLVINNQKFGYKYDSCEYCDGEYHQ